MANTLTATPLPDRFAVRLNINTDSSWPVVLDETWSDYTSAQVVATVLPRWATAGTAITTGAPGNMVIGSSAAGASTPATDYVSRTITGLVVGGIYRVTFGGSLYAVILECAGTTLPLGTNTSTAPSTDLTFTATATSHTLFIRLAGVYSSQISSVTIRKTSAVPTYVQDLTAAWATAWPKVGAAITNGSWSSTSPATNNGANLPTTYKLVATAQMNNGYTATLPAGTYGVARTFTGLSIGSTYEVAALATSRLAPQGGPSTPARFTVGIAGGATSDPIAVSGSALADITWRFTATATSHSVQFLWADAITLTRNDAAVPVVNTSAFLQLNAVALRVVDPPASVSLVSVTRSDANGVRPVRLYAGQGITDNLLTVTDYEPALVGLVNYTAVVNNTLAGAITLTASTSLDVDSPRIAPVSRPGEGVTVDLITEYTAEHATSTTLATVIGRPDPLPTIGTQATRAGTLEVWCADYTTAQAVRRTFASGDVVVVRQPDFAGLDMYCVGTRVAVEPYQDKTTTRRWKVVVDYSEVASPATPLMGSLGWTIAASSARNPTLAASAAEFPTVAALAIGPAS